MSEIRLLGLAGIDMADVPVGGGVPLDADFDFIGATYRDEALIGEDDPTETNHFANEYDDPIESDITGGKKKLTFTLTDWSPENLAKYLGGTTEGVGAAMKWLAPAQKTKYERAFRIRSKTAGQYITHPRVSCYAKYDYKLAPTGIAKVLIVGVVMTPEDAAPMITGTLAAV
jgi:hypothetical protein